VYPEKSEPEGVIITALNYENDAQYHLAYQFLSSDYKLNNEIYNYKDYMKKPSSYLANSPLEINQNTKFSKKENKDGSVTVSFKDANNQNYSINLISTGDNWYINSKVY